MKLLISLLFLLGTGWCKAQRAAIDSLSREVTVAADDSTKIRALNQLSIAYENYKPDSAILWLQSSLHLSRKMAEDHGEYKFEYYALSQTGYLFGLISNYPKALEFYVESLKVAENMNMPRNIATANNNIAVILQKENENEKALAYFTIADSIIEKNNLSDLKHASLGNFGNIFFKLNKLDSALFFTMQAYELEKTKTYDPTDEDAPRFTGLWLTNLGNIYSKQTNIPAALSNYKQALPYSRRANDMDIVCEIKLGLARLYEKIGDTTNAIAEIDTVFLLADKNNFESRRLEGSIFLTNYYKNVKKFDSAFKYQELMVSIKDTINSNERIKASLNITIEEELRQHEKIELLAKEKEARDKTLQLLGVGLLIPSLFLFSIFIRRKKIKPQIIKFCGIVSLLMFFECVTLLLHPYVVQLSHHVVVIELLIFVCIAAVIIPTHHRIEHWLTSKLTAHKNAAHH
ncbi:MAG: tetratricopeptide repeat protein [Chitinophagaceae bacterium]